MQTGPQKCGLFQHILQQKGFFAIKVWLIYEKYDKQIFVNAKISSPALIHTFLYRDVVN
jgi:hypothetical protein